MSAVATKQWWQGRRHATPEHALWGSAWGAWPCQAADAASCSTRHIWCTSLHWEVAEPPFQGMPMPCRGPVY